MSGKQMCVLFPSSLFLSCFTWLLFCCVCTPILLLHTLASAADWREGRCLFLMGGKDKRKGRLISEIMSLT